MNQVLFEKHILPVANKPITMLSLKKDVPKEEKQKSKQEVIYDLVSQGVSIVDIAKKMNIGQGEVSLILSLKKEGN
jgi:DNA-binding NarL/FixJ family response regulator